MIPDPEAMSMTALILEDQANDRGWDSMPPMHGVVAKAGVGFGVGTVPFNIAWNEQGDLVVGLRELTKIMRDHRVNEGKTGRGPEQLSGIWVLYEGATEPDMDESECRVVLLLDCAGILHVVCRLRGEEPESTSFMHDDEMKTRDPEVVIALRDLMLEYVVWMPEGTADLVAISRWGEKLNA